MMLTSRSTSSRSSSFGTVINFAANLRPEVFSAHRKTVPNFPLVNSKIDLKLIVVSYYSIDENGEKNLTLSACFC